MPLETARQRAVAAAPGDVARLEAAEVVVVHAARRVVTARAAGGPLGDEEQVRREAPRGVRLEHVVLERVVVRPAPVVGDLAGVVVAERVRGRRRLAHPRRPAAAASARLLLDADEAVHPPAVDVGLRGVGVVLPAAVHLVGIVERTRAGVRARVGHAGGEAPVLHREAVGAREGAEVRVEGAVLLHQDDHVPDAVDPVAAADPSEEAHGRRRGAAEAGAAAERCDEDECETRRADAHDPDYRVST